MSNQSKTHRLRIFAGPNGSGKSTLAEKLKEHQDKRIKLGVFVNADEIQKLLNHNEDILLENYCLSNISTKEIHDYLNNLGFSKKMIKQNIDEYIVIKNNKIKLLKNDFTGYLAADIAGFIRNKLLEQKQNFSFETVMSHPSKLEFLSKAKKQGYKIYLYYITTDDVLINIDRVSLRVEKSGHDVPENKIRQRYYKSLDLLYDAIRLTHRAYLFDNSEKYFNLVAEVTQGKHINLTDFNKSLPNWFIEYIYNKINKNNTP